MEENEDEPEDVRKATPVADEIKLGLKNEKSTKQKKDSHSDKNAIGKSTMLKSHENCFPNIKRKKPSKSSKMMSVLIYSPPCKLPKLEIIPRHCLSKQEYINVLSTPSRKCPSSCIGKSGMRKVRPISGRMNELAQPARRLICGTLKERGETLPPEMINNLIKSIEGSGCMTPEQAERYFKEKERKVDGKCKKSLNRHSRIQKCKEKLKPQCPSNLDKDAVICQYIMAEKFVKSILEWKCPIPVEEFKDISSVILRRLSFVLEYKPVDNSGGGGGGGQHQDLKSQQMRFLADIIACWISGVLFEVAEEHRKEIEQLESVEKREEESEEEDEDEDDESVKEIKEPEEEEEENEEKEEEKKIDEVVKEIEKETKDSTTQDVKVGDEKIGDKEIVVIKSEPVDNTEKEDLVAKELAKLKLEMEALEDEKARFEKEKRIWETEELEKRKKEEEEKLRKEKEENEARLKVVMEEEEERRKKQAEEDEERRKRWEEEDQRRKEIAEKEEEEREKKKQKELEEEEEKRKREAEDKKKREKQEEEEARKRKEEKEKEKLKEDEMLEEVGPKNAIDKIGDDKLFKGDIPFVTFGKIIDTLYKMLEEEPEGDETDIIHNRIQRVLYEKFENLIELETPELLTENLKDTADVLSGKIASWIKSVLKDSELKFLNLNPPEIESKEIRNWGKWIDQVTNRAVDWADWIHRIVNEANAKSNSSNNIKRIDWKNWTSDLETKALLWRRYYLETIHQAHHNKMMIDGRKVVKTGEKKELIYSPILETEIKNMDLM